LSIELVIVGLLVWLLIVEEAVAMSVLRSRPIAGSWRDERASLRERIDVTVFALMAALLGHTGGSASQLMVRYSQETPFVNHRA